MKTYIIIYDLNQPGQDYTRLIKKIESVFECWWNHLESTWIVRTNLSAEAIRDTLLPLTDPNDELLVIGLREEAAWSGFDELANEWLTENVQGAG
ncbi:MAG: hypothetical protein JNM68_07730 [Dinghuibacter sp.]|nr:hypothetical protein [Dinghuibacter sp.]